ncbi:MAG: hypothetical protein AAFW67_13925, partial [Cyanobacteria bacterium J06638_38]
MSESVSVRADAAFNKLQNTLIKLGGGVLVAVEPAIEALNFLVDRFAELPEPMQEFIGLAILVTGGVLTLGAAFLTAATAFGTMSAALGPAVKGLGSMATAAKGLTTFGSISTGIKSVTLSLTAMKASAVAALPVLAALAGAVAAVTLAVKQYQNIETELRNIELRGLQQETQLLADKATTLGLRIQETGEAIPDDEFNSWIAILQDANEGNGELTGIIDALIRKQEEAKGTTEGLGDASGDASGAVDELGMSLEEQEEAAKKAKEEFDKYKSSVQ